MVFNTTFNNISAITWLSVLLVEETRVPGENHKNLIKEIKKQTNKQTKQLQICKTQAVISMYKIILPGYTFDIILLHGIFTFFLHILSRTTGSSRLKLKVNMIQYPREKDVKLGLKQ